MAEEKTFSQEDVNQIVEERIARAREKWAKDSEGLCFSEALKAQLASKGEELSAIKREHFVERAQRDVRDELARFGVTEPGRVERAMKFIDFSEASDSSFAVNQVQSLVRDVPELFPPRGAGSGGSKTPVLSSEKPLTRQEVEAMSLEQVNSNWSRVSRFLQGERS
jgi:hypothetical protein